MKIEWNYNLNKLLEKTQIDVGSYVYVTTTKGRVHKLPLAMAQEWACTNLIVAWTIMEWPEPAELPVKIVPARPVLR